MGKMFPLIRDTHYNWSDIHFLQSETTETVTIEKLRAISATHGIPEVIASDNVSVFTSTDVKVFIYRRNGIGHNHSAVLSVFERFSAEIPNNLPSPGTNCIF